MASSKECFKCLKEKPVDDFYRHPGMTDGRIGKCKECTKADVIANRKDKVEYYREYDLDRSKLPHRKALCAKKVAEWHAADRRRASCHNAVARAIKAGRLTKQPCSCCGSEKSMAHHESYDRKLDVTWLCQPCHKARHKEMNRLGIVP